MLCRLSIPERMLPDKKLQTVMSAIHAEIPTIINVLVDQVGHYVLIRYILDLLVPPRISKMLQLFDQFTQHFIEPVLDVIEVAYCSYLILFFFSAM